MGLGGAYWHRLRWGSLAHDAQKETYQLSGTHGNILGSQVLLLQTTGKDGTSYLNRQGGTVFHSLCRLALSLWDFCIQNSIHPISVHLPGEHNTTADTLSRGLTPFHEMELNWTYLS